MARQTVFYVQEVMTRGLDPVAPARAAGFDAVSLPARGVIDALDALEADFDPGRIKPVFFVSLPAAKYIQRKCPRLASGVALPQAFLEHATYSSHLAPELLLNPDGIYLPWGRIPARLQMIERHFGSRIFLRPNSPMKPFAGFDLPVSDVPFEHRARPNIDPGEMTFIATARKVPGDEFRVWILDAQVATATSYAWEDRPTQAVPGEVLAAARRVAQDLQYVEQCYTADFVVMPEGVKLVELNAISTSGWYPGLDLKALFESCNEVFL